jgi:hypothetical protein
MKTIVNKTGRPLRVSLPGGKVLHLGPHKTGQIADNASDHASVRKLIEDGTLEIQGEGGEDNKVTEPGASGGAHGESTHGHGKATLHRRGGQRGA